MKYAIIKVVNGAFFIHAEDITNLALAKTKFHGVCQTLWNASDVRTACVMLTNDNLEIVGSYKEHISHEE